MRNSSSGAGVEVSVERHFSDGAWVDGPGGDWNSFAFFSDPNGNGWVLQESPAATDAAARATGCSYDPPDR